MPTNYRFLKDGKAAKLSDVDKEICKWYCQERIGNQYSQGYLFVVMSGIALTERIGDEGRKLIRENDVEQFCNDVHDGDYKELLKEFLVKRYTFKAWWAA